MNLPPKTLQLIKPGHQLPNFIVQLNSRKTDFNTFRERKWTILFTHPEQFIPKNLSSMKAFLELQNFLIKHNAKLLGLNPENGNLSDYENFELGKNSKIIVSDSRGIVRSILVLNEMNYSFIKKTLKEIQIVDRERLIRKRLDKREIKEIEILKTDQQGFHSSNLFFQKINVN